MIRMLQSAVISKLLYACSVWVSFHKAGASREYTIIKLKKFQKKPLAVMSGPPSITSLQALETELNVLPIEFCLRKINYSPVSGIQSLPVYEELSWCKGICKSNTQYVKTSARHINLKPTHPSTDLEHLSLRALRRIVTESITLVGIEGTPCRKKAYRQED